ISLHQKLAAADRKVTTMGRDDAALRDRVAALEQGTVNVASVAGAVLPSVFRIDVPDGTATAFAIGKASSGTDLLTNYHVVATLWKSGNWDRSSAPDDQRYPVHPVRVQS